MMKTAILLSLATSGALAQAPPASRAPPSRARVVTLPSPAAARTPNPDTTFIVKLRDGAAGANAPEDVVRGAAGAGLRSARGHSGAMRDFVIVDIPDAAARARLRAHAGVECTHRG